MGSGTVSSLLGQTLRGLALLALLGLIQALGLATPVQAQMPYWRFEHVKPSEIEGTVYAVLQDRDGFIWRRHDRNGGHSRALAIPG